MLRCEFLRSSDGVVKFRFLKGGAPLHFGYQSEWATWPQFREAYERQISLLSGPVPDLDALESLYRDALLYRVS